MKSCGQVLGRRFADTFPRSQVDEGLWCGGTEWMACFNEHLLETVGTFFVFLHTLLAQLVCRCFSPLNTAHFFHLCNGHAAL